MVYRCIRIFTVILGCFSTWTQADEFAVKFSGFASLAVSYSDDPDIDFRSNYLNDEKAGWSIDRDSILGGQVNISLAQEWDSVVQVVLQDREIKDFSNYLELAFVRYRPNRNWSVRGGRINSDMYLLSEYPSVGYAYLWARPPHEHYAFASTVSHYDGFDVEYSSDVNEGYLRVKLAAAQTEPKLGALNQDFSIKFNNILTLSTTYVKDAWTFRASTSKADIREFKSDQFSSLINALNAIPPSLWSQAADYAQGFDAKNKNINYSALGLAYDNFDWLFQAEIGTVNSDWLISPSNYTGYVSLGYRIGELTYFASLSVAKNKNAKPQVAPPELPSYLPEEIRLATLQLVEGTDIASKRAIVDQYSFNIGAKWYFSNNLVIKAQIDHFVLQPIGGGLWDMAAQTDVASKHQINLFSLSGSVVF